MSDEATAREFGVKQIPAAVLFDDGVPGERQLANLNFPAFNDAARSFLIQSLKISISKKKVPSPNYYD